MKTVIIRLMPLISGILFGVGMALSGMIDPEKVIGFLNVTGNWDPSLAFVMGGALLVFMPSYFLFIEPKMQTLSGDSIPAVTNQKIDSRLLTGSALFGIGWGLVGICPGPAISSLMIGGLPVIIFLSSMIIGSLLAMNLASSEPKVSLASRNQ
ncbi:YeeE/YedE family protein [Vibrio sp. RE86]|uniref:YeeE/YedE family protein n=1 Tax=Vibrio sp. RE86 TaxID=2607605 RepID=UPI00149390A5|nr:YeeE/YedE family protein [Vibrio sp. RE86]NOH81717.1 YeeE/YedE family protein [Vibrio sp. RE86]